MLVSIHQDQFGGSAFEDAGMHLHNFTELCNMTRIKDYDRDTLKLCLFPFSFRGKAKERRRYPGLGGTNLVDLLSVGRAYGPPISQGRPSEASNLGVIKMDSVEDYTCTPRIASAIGMCFPSWQPTMCNPRHPKYLYKMRG